MAFGRKLYQEPKINLESTAAMSNIGAYLFLKNDLAGAVTLWERVLKKNPALDVLFNMGMAYRQLFLQQPGEGYGELRRIAPEWLAQ